MHVVCKSCGSCAQDLLSRTLTSVKMSMAKCYWGTKELPHILKRSLTPEIICTINCYF